jgi:hypothetical protein
LNKQKTYIVHNRYAKKRDTDRASTTKGCSVLVALQKKACPSLSVFDSIHSSFFYTSENINNSLLLRGFISLSMLCPMKADGFFFCTVWKTQLENQ